MHIYKYAKKTYNMFFFVDGERYIYISEIHTTCCVLSISSLTSKELASKLHLRRNLRPPTLNLAPTRRAGGRGNTSERWSGRVMWGIGSWRSVGVVELQRHPQKSNTLQQAQYFFLKVPPCLQFVGISVNFKASTILRCSL